MDLSIFLARLLGLYLIIIAAELLFRRKELSAAVKDLASSKGLLVFTGSLSLLLGLAIVIAHPFYEQTWRGFITLLGYLLILRGVWRISFPSQYQRKLVSIFQKRYWIVLIVILLIGVYLTNVGYSECCM